MDAFRILHPWYLLLLLAIPLLWYTARQVRVLGRGRKALTLALRSLVILFFILALSEVEMLDRGDTLASLKTSSNMHWRMCKNNSTNCRPKIRRAFCSSAKKPPFKKTPAKA